MTSTVSHTEYGDRDLALTGEILRTVVGSGVHGIAIEGTDDHDEMGVRRSSSGWQTGTPRCQPSPTWT